MGRLHGDVVSLLQRCPITEQSSGRSYLLHAIPDHLRDALQRDPGNRLIDLGLIVDQLARLGRLDGGLWPVLIVLDAARQTVAGTALGDQIAAMMRELEASYGRVETMPPIEAAPHDLTESERLVFGTDHRVSFEFLRGAMQTARAIARIEVPLGNACSYGTGWLVMPGLMMTNWHVLDADTGADAAELRARAARTAFWFDYHTEGTVRTDVRGARLVHHARELDYALLALDHDLGDRPPIAIHREPVTLERGARLNIAQHPSGGPLRLAIRSNYHVESAATAVRYVTDTESGSSGAPVCDDRWQAIALHARAVEIREQQLPGGRSRWVNEGVLLSAILADRSLPRGLL
jgi:V8-like Glu-specific endopeptidase